MMRTLRILVAASALLAGVAHAEGKKKTDLRSAELYLHTLTGQATKLQPYAGKKITLLNLWATWCGPCREEMPALTQMHEKYKARGFAVVGVDIDERPEDVRRFLQRNKVGYPMLTSTEHKTVEVLGELEALPTSVLLDENGAVLEVMVGAIEVPYIEKILDTTLGAKK
jgi:thiol-disulfide isomerase/thioredoxin